jgi:transposase-like protein
MAISELVQKKIEQLYVKEGYSMTQIAQQLSCSVSVVRYWLGKNNIDRRSISEAINNLYATKFHKVPFQLKKSLSADDEALKIAGVMLYWGEGAKTGNAVKFANSDPEMIVVFINFLVRICGISQDRMKVLVHMYPDHNESELKEFWSRTTRIPTTQFYKTYIHVGRKGTYKRKSPYGTLAISYSDKKLLDILLSWIEQYKGKLG